MTSVRLCDMMHTIFKVKDIAGPDLEVGPGSGLRHRWRLVAAAARAALAALPALAAALGAGAAALAAGGTRLAASAFTCRIYHHLGF